MNMRGIRPDVSYLDSAPPSFISRDSWWFYVGQRLLNRNHALASQMTVADWICQVTQQFALPILGKRMKECYLIL